MEQHPEVPGVLELLESRAPLKETGIGGIVRSSGSRVEGITSSLRISRTLWRGVYSHPAFLWWLLCHTVWLIRCLDGTERREKFDFIGDYTKKGPRLANHQTEKSELKRNVGASSERIKSKVLPSSSDLHTAIGTPGNLYDSQDCYLGAYHASTSKCNFFTRIVCSPHFLWGSGWFRYADPPAAIRIHEAFLDLCNLGNALYIPVVSNQHPRWWWSINTGTDESVPTSVRYTLVLVFSRLVVQNEDFIELNSNETQRDTKPYNRPNGQYWSGDLMNLDHDGESSTLSWLNTIQTLGISPKIGIITAWPDCERKFRYEHRGGWENT